MANAKVAIAKRLKVTEIPLRSEDLEIIFIVVILASLMLAICITGIICLCVLRFIFKSDDLKALTPNVKKTTSKTKITNSKQQKKSLTRHVSDVSVDRSEPYYIPATPIGSPCRASPVTKYGSESSASVSSDSHHVAAELDRDMPSSSSAYSAGRRPSYVPPMNDVIDGSDDLYISSENPY